MNSAPLLPLALASSSPTLEAGALSLGLALAFSAMSLPLWRRACPRLGLMDEPGGRKSQAHAIPLAGGLAALTGLVLAVALPVGALEDLRAAWQAAPALWVTVLVGCAAMTLLGLLDDRHELNPAPKFLLQLGIALAVAATGLRVTLFIPHLLFQYTVTALWILTVTNAFNFMDNMNGLCAGVGALAAGTLGLLAARHEQLAEATFAFALCGALLGFLPFNYPRASAYLGDAGSHLVGFSMAVVAMLPSFHTETEPQPLGVFKPLLILIVPLADLAWVVIWRTLHGQAFYVGDTNHLSHQLVRRGLSRPMAVAVLWLCTAAGCALALW
jgi:UDP-GlcNAc:undecaprenyl-phosphate GlcNAc-1-phosphate transferase